MYKLLTRHEKREDEKCPLCKEIFRDFIIMNDMMLACRVCGLVFVKKDIREYITENLKGILDKQANTGSAMQVKKDKFKALGKDKIESLSPAEIAKEVGCSTGYAKLLKKNYEP